MYINEFIYDMIIESEISLCLPMSVTIDSFLVTAGIVVVVVVVVDFGVVAFTFTILPKSPSESPQSSKSMARLNRC